jgi:cytochrome c553
MTVRGEALVTTGAGGTTAQCAACHGQTLQGLTGMPPIARRQATYIVRQLFDFQDGTRSGPSATLMQALVEKLTVDDMLAIAAYTASRSPD